MDEIGDLAGQFETLEILIFYQSEEHKYLELFRSRRVWSHSRVLYMIGTCFSCKNTPISTCIIRPWLLKFRNLNFRPVAGASKEVVAFWG